MRPRKTVCGGALVLAGALANAAPLWAADACEAAGALNGTFSGDAEGPIRLLVDAGDGAVTGVAGDSIAVSGTREVEAGIASISGSAEGMASFEGQFGTAETFHGSWQAPLISGTISVSRIGGAGNARFRFTGRFSGDAAGSLAFDVTPQGEATGVVLDQQLRVLDTLSGTVDDGVLDASTSAGASLSATVDLAGGVFNGSWSFAGRVGTIMGQGCELPDDITLAVDYRFDNEDFFATPQRRLAFEQTIEQIASRLGDDLAAIEPGGGNTWEMLIKNPATGDLTSIPEEVVRADTLRIFVGTRDLSAEVGRGGVGGFSFQGDSAFADTVRTRGEAGATGDPATATDLGPWGGQIAFDSDPQFLGGTRAQWFFGADLDQIGASEISFRDTAAHEFVHLLGFGFGVPPFERLVDAGAQTFTGDAAMAAFDGSGAPPLASDLSHWASGLMDDERLTLMTPGGDSTLSQPTGLDKAALADIGWEISGIAP